jgi:hypothetical protein
MKLDEATLETLQPFIGTVFHLLVPGAVSVDLKLVDILPFEKRQRRRSTRGPRQKRDPFAMYFLGPPDPILPQAMYEFRSDRLTFENLFIVPIGRDEEATEYEAVFT